MIRAAFRGLLMVAVGLAALEAEGFLSATGAAIALPAITVAAKIEHGATGRKVAHALAKDLGTGNRHRFEKTNTGEEKRQIVLAATRARTILLVRARDAIGSPTTILADVRHSEVTT